MMGFMRTGELLLGEERERPLVNRLTFILSFFMLTTGYVFYYSFYGCPFEIKSLKLEHKIEEEVKEKTFYENLLTIIYGEDRKGQVENIAEEEAKWSELVSDWWVDFSGDGTKSSNTDNDNTEILEETPYNNSIKVLFKSILWNDKEDASEAIEMIRNQNQTKEAFSEPEPEQSWSLFSFNFASAASLPDNKTETEEDGQSDLIDFIENDKNIEKEKSSGNVLTKSQCDHVAANTQPQMIEAAE